MRNNFPKSWHGLRIGLLGGSFDPPHQGHVHISKWALRNFQLDWVWWLVSPGNPLKKEGPAPIKRRLDAANTLINHPRILVTDLERQFKTRYTAKTLEKLFQNYPTTNFMWLMGADNMCNFHHWDQWRWIMENIPIGIMARPHDQIKAGLSPAARCYKASRLPAGRAEILPQKQAPAWALLNGRMVNMSSTELRKRGDWVR